MVLVGVNAKLFAEYLLCGECNPECGDCVDDIIEFLCCIDCCWI